MDKKNNLITHISETLRHHEEPYVLGSWERFQRERNKKNRTRNRKLLFTIAASILLMLTFAFLWSDIGNQADENYTEERKNEIPAITEDNSNQPPALNSQTLTPRLSDSQGQAVKEENSEKPKHNNIVLVDSSVKTIGDDELLASISQGPAILSSIKIPRIQKSQPGLKNFDKVLHGSGSNNHIQSASKNLFVEDVGKYDDLRIPPKQSVEKDIALSVSYSSLMNVHNSETDITMGGGVHIDWMFTENLALTSGLSIAQNHLKFRNNPESNLMETMDQSELMLFSANDLSYLQLDLVNLEIPINLRYSVTERFSISAGISSVTFLKENYQYNFKYDQQIQVFEGNGTTGTEPVTRTVTLRSSQNQSNPPLDQVNWGAFYNFSIGYQYNIFDGTVATFAPFLKLPSGSITSRGFSFTTGGIQLKITFQSL